MGMALSIIGFLGFIGCIVWLIIVAIRKQKMQNSLIGMGIALALFIIGVVNSPSSQTVSGSVVSGNSKSTTNSAILSSAALVSSESKASVVNSSTPVSKTPASSASASSKKSATELRKSAKSIAYKELARYPDKYKNQFIKFNGKVVQSIDNSGSFTLRVAQNEDYNQMFLVSYVPLNDARILENDSITVYGTYQGVQSYTSTLGAEITIPYVLSADIVIK